MESANNFRNINMYGKNGKVRVIYNSKNGKATQDQKVFLNILTLCIWFVF